VETDIEKVKRYKSPDIYEILEKMAQAGNKMLHSQIHKLINSIWNNEELP
jgi:hypothetical protein